MTNPEAPSLRRIVTTSFDVAFPIFMGLGLAVAVSLMMAFLFQSIAWDDPRIKMSAAMAVLVPLGLPICCPNRTQNAWNKVLLSM